MSNLLNPSIEEIEQNPEVKSFIYQQIVDFQPFITEQTVVSVVAKDPTKLAIQLETEGRAVPRSELKKMYRIAISLKEDDAEIQEEGLHRNIFEAIKIAKEKLILKLIEIQEAVESSSDRQDQINHALSNTQLH